MKTNKNSLCEKLETDRIKEPEGGEPMAGRKLQVVFTDKEGKWYPLDEVNGDELAVGLQEISKEIAKRLQLKKEQR